MDSQPSCYGKSWDPNHVECKGGLDPAYTNPDDQTHRRDRCSWFQPCSQKMMQPVTVETPPSQPLIPTRALLQHRAVEPPPVRPPAPPVYSPPRPPTYTAPQTQYSLPPPQAVPVAPPPPPYHQQGPAPYAYRQPPQVVMAPPYVAQYGQQQVYMPFQHPESQVPQYLTMPEPVNDDEHWGVRLGRTLFRTGVKALALGLASYFDSNPIRRHDR